MFRIAPLNIVFFLVAAKQLNRYGYIDVVAFSTFGAKLDIKVSRKFSYHIIS